MTPACGNLWTNKEVAILARMYAEASEVDIRAALRRRSWDAICRQANKMGCQRLHWNWSKRRTLPVSVRRLRLRLMAESYFMDRATMGPIEAQHRFTRP